MAQLLGLGLVMEIFAMISPLFLSWVIDHAIVSADRDLLVTLALAFVLLLLLETATSAMRAWMVMGLNASLKVQARANLFSHLLNLPAAYFEARKSRFRYGEQEPWILKNIDLRIAAGESIAIIGPSGGGKSTLLKLLSGLLAPSAGEILVNGEPLARIGLENYRAMLGVVMQDDQLFASG
jgi:ABC-type bacteriocin/lantibiotic exporter with double-glycine peptidase domain